VPTSASVRSAGDRGPSSDSSSLLKRLAGVVRRPARTFRAVVARPNWADALAVTTLWSVVVSAGFAGTAVGQLALLDGLEQTTYAFGHEMTDAQYGWAARVAANSAAYAAAGALLTGPVLAFAIAGLAYGAGRRQGANRPTFRQVLAVTVHAGAILALRQVVAAPVGYLSETAANPMSLSRWMPVDAASPLARGFGFVDVFFVWWAIVLSVGLAVVLGRRARPLALGMVGAYAALALLVTLAAAGLTA
jgi:Yip1-like protein